MNITYRNAILFQLQLVYGITVAISQRKRKIKYTGSRTRTFGVPLEKLPGRCIPQFGEVPCILVEACSFLLERAGTVGLFRKPGSSIRMNALKAKLNVGEGCLSTALPSDVASLLKLFCRELPEPLFPSELHEALLQAQALPTRDERTSATQLLSCLLPDPNTSLLCYLFAFLSKISQRCAENLMTSSNLAVVFTPCLLAPVNTLEMSEVRLKPRVQVLRFFIEKPDKFGVVPKAVMDSVEFLHNFRPLPDTPVPKRTERGAHAKRHCLKGAAVTAAVTPPIRVDQAGDGQGSSEKRLSLRRSLGLESLPNVVLFRKYTLHTEEQEAKGKCKMPGETPKRTLWNASCFPSFTRSQDVDSPVLLRVGKLNMTPWKRQRRRTL